jgi:hypothetical protein
MVPIPTYGHLMTFQEFGEDVRNGCLIDYDGYGLWATETLMLDDHKQKIWPSNYVSGQKPKEGFTHIVWFNR